MCLMNKMVNQSSTAGTGYTADKAIDGNTDGDITRMSCSMTRKFIKHFIISTIETTISGR